MVQTPAVVQQAPCGGCGQGAPPVPQVWPLVHTFGDAQLICTVLVHVPSEGEQQVPMGGCAQGDRPSGPQTCPLVQTLEAAQLI